MGLSADLIAKFAKATKVGEKTSNESTLHGTAIVDNNGNKYVVPDGSEGAPIPVSFVSNVQDGDRVLVMIQNHSAIIVGNLTNPSTAMSDISGMVQNLEIANAKIIRLDAAYGEFKDLTTENFAAVNAILEKLDTTYANIDFANIGTAAMEYFYAKSGLIKDVTIGDQTITGHLVGVTISGDLIEGNTIKAEKLVIKGSDGLYYKLNTDGVTTEAEQTDENSINGSVIKAKSITATKISVNDLVAFGATIGGFNISDISIYSGAKSSVDNSTRGIYMDKDGQLAVGDVGNYIKYYKDAEGNYRLAISVKNLVVDGADLSEAGKTATNFIEYDAENGLQLGDKTGGAWSGFRSQITNAAFNILNGVGNVVASYGASLIELGKNSVDAVIKLCGGMGTIQYNSDEDYLDIMSDSIRMKGVEMASVETGYTDSSGVKRSSAVHVAPTSVDIRAGINRNGSWQDNGIYVSTSGISIKTDDGTMTDNDTGAKYVSFTEGTSGIWKYRRWSNGFVELWGTYNISNMACTAALGNWYRTAVFYPNSFPFTISNPKLTANYESDGYGALLWATTTTTASSPPNYYLIRPTSATIASGKIIFYVTGTV